jgi:hypothetical protein
MLTCFPLLFPFTGIIPRSCEHIFNYIEKDTSGTEFTIKCSFLEIYKARNSFLISPSSFISSLLFLLISKCLKEVIRDLLNPEKVNLKVRESPTRGLCFSDFEQKKNDHKTIIISVY